MNKEQFAFHSFSPAKIIPKGIGSNPYTDWKIMMAISCIIVIVLVYAGYTTYVSVGASLDSGTSGISGRATAGFDIVSLQQLQSHRDQVDTARAAALSGSGIPSDPSK